MRLLARSLVVVGVVGVLVPMASAASAWAPIGVVAAAGPPPGRSALQHGRDGLAEPAGGSTVGHSTATSPATVVVPSLVGLKLGVAERRLRARGLSTGWPPDARRYEPAGNAQAFSNHAVVVPGTGAELRVTGQDLNPGQRVAVGTTVGLTTVRAPGSPQTALPAIPLGFALARDGRTLTMRFHDEGGRCRPLDDVEVEPGAQWIVVQALVLEADSPGCRPASRSVRLVLPSRVAGRPILTVAPTFPQAGLSAPAPAPWSGGYLTPDHRTAVVTFLYGACTRLAGITATVVGGVAHVTIYEGGTRTPVPYPIQPYFACILIAYTGETFVRLPHRARVLAGAGPELPLIRSHELADVLAVSAPGLPTEPHRGSGLSHFW